jgi:phosphothreonine lyase
LREIGISFEAARIHSGVNARGRTDINKQLEYYQKGKVQLEDALRLSYSDDVLKRDGEGRRYHFSRLRMMGVPFKDAVSFSKIPRNAPKEYYEKIKGINRDDVNALTSTKPRSLNSLHSENRYVPTGSTPAPRNLPSESTLPDPADNGLAGTSDDRVTHDGKISRQKEHLNNNLNSYFSAIDNMAENSFEFNYQAPDYEEFLNSPDKSELRENEPLIKKNNHNGLVKFRDETNRNFANATRMDANSARCNGDKFHISVDQGQIEGAYKSIAGYLFSADSPLMAFKMSDIEYQKNKYTKYQYAKYQDNFGRTLNGAQFTLYIDDVSSPDEIKKVRDFLQVIENKLATDGVNLGLRPNSDVSRDEYNYISYRNEWRSDRIGGQAQSESLKA